MLFLIPKFIFGVYSPQYVFLMGQNRINSQLMWQEISNDHIIYDYLLPAKEIDLLDLYNRSNLSRWHTLAGTNASVRSEPSLSFGNRTHGLREIISGTIVIELTSRFFIQHDFEFDSNGLDDPHYHQGIIVQSVGDWTGYIQHSSLTYFYEHGHFLIGKSNLFSSIYMKSLLINPDFPPGEVFWFHHKNGRIQYDWSIILLNSVSEKNRFLSLHRYGYETDFWRIGFSEMVIVPYEHFGIDQMRYLLPTSIFFETEINGGANSNLMWGIDWLLKIKKFTINGEILIDDIAIDKKSPLKVGFKIGLGGYTSLFKYYIEYVRINRWTGNYYYPARRYIENMVLIGHPLGPDAHSISINLQKEIMPSLLLENTLVWIENGSGDIFEWPEGLIGNGNFGWNDEPFPSRPISTIYNFITGIRYYYKNLSLEFESSLSSTSKHSLTIELYYGL